MVMVASGAHKYMKGELKDRINYDAKYEGTLSLNDAMDVYGMVDNKIERD